MTEQTTDQGRHLFTPRTPEGARLRLHISTADIRKVGRGTRWSATVTDLDSGVVYAARGAACGLGCFCDAIARVKR